MMKTHIMCSSDEDEYESSRLGNCWWRSAAKFEECAKLPRDVPHVSTLTPRLRLLREMERLALIAPDGLHELKRKLQAYRSGDFWVPTGGIQKEDMDIPPVITILLLGFTGSGKTSLVNLMYSVLGRSGVIPFAHASTGSSSDSSHTAMLLQEHNVLRSLQNGFCVYDSRGYPYDQVANALEDLSTWMADGVHHNQLCLGPGADVFTQNEDNYQLLASSSKFVTRKVNCVMVVANVAEIYKAVKAGDSKPLEAITALFCSPALRKSNENPLLILTHGDMLSTEERIDGRLIICKHLGLSEATGAYDIACLTQYGLLAQESDPTTAYALSEAVYRALLISDRGHFPKKNVKDWALLVLSWLLFLLGALFSFLARLCTSHVDRKKLKL